MKVSTQLSYNASPAEIAKQAVELEAAGVDLVWVAELYSFDAISLMGYLAAVTDRIASAGHIADYAPTPDRTPPPAYHIDDSIADFLNTSRDPRGHGSTGPSDLPPGMDDYANWAGYSSAYSSALFWDSLPAAGAKLPNEQLWRPGWLRESRWARPFGRSPQKLFGKTTAPSWSSLVSTSPP